MWPNKSIDYVKLPNDIEGRHYGLFLNEKLISVISLFITDTEAQFRKFATIKEYQGKGYGSLLLQEIIGVAKNENLSKIWCNARQNKTDFYTKFGMVSTNRTFVKGAVDFVIMESLLP
ncbi:MAG TPA: GNAT family N-acetyltransferase [Maribacter sp.]|nr:GNAT family N-acetyltransferase [Maribacter sp.]HEA81841.1 GNAT family N-acetyltransferase [Maribacter sp.]